MTTAATGDGAIPPTGSFIRGAVPAIVLGWLVVAVVAVMADWPAIRAMRLADADDALRLVQVRALLAGQGWFDLHAYRIDPPMGVVMHWSRLVDLPLAGLIALLHPWIGQVAAERATAVSVPLVTLLAAQVCLGRIVWRQLGRDFVLIATVTMALLLPAMAQFAPLRIDHHGWQIAAVAAALNGLVSGDALRGGRIAGIALAFGLSISLELLPFAVLIGAVFALRGVLDPAQRRWLVDYLGVLTVGSGALFLLTRGIGDLGAYCDAMSPAYLAGLGMVTLAVATGWTGPVRTRAWRIGALIGAGVLGVAVMLWLAPACSRGPFARLDPLVRDFWYNNVTEGLPVWHQGLAVAVQMVLPPLLGWQAAVRLARATGSVFWRDYAVVLGGAIVIGVAVSRFSAVAAAIAVVPLAWQLRDWAAGIAAPGPHVRKLGWAVLVSAGLLPGVVLDGVAHGWAWLAPSAVPALRRDPPIAEACGLPGSLAVLRRVPASTILAPLDIGPHLLMGTSHRVVATGHHRAVAAMHDVISAFLGSPEQAHQIAQQHGADYVLLCTDLTEVGMYRYRGPNGLAARLLAGQRIDWLVPVDLGPGPVRLWRVVR
ncbi:MAG: hypothetical protein RLZZ427_601 [Pseudomonadota bacterium]|jgi:hypothetical protein